MPYLVINVVVVNEETTRQAMRPQGTGVTRVDLERARVLPQKPRQEETVLTSAHHYV